MKNFLQNKLNIFYIFLFFYFIVGSYLSLSVGITHDEAHSNWVWELNKKKLLNIFFNKEYDVSYLETYHGFYGIGFYLVSTPIEILYKNLVNIKNIDFEGNILLLKHPIVFIFFVISGIFFRKIILLVTKDKLFSDLTTILYLTYPYILGHSFFNIKDIPFMSVWLVNTFLIIKILDGIFNKILVKKKDFIALGILTAYLLSLRISGILIFIEYLIFFIFYLNNFNIKFLNFLKPNIKNIFIFLTSFIFFSFLFYPSFWLDPLKFLDAFKFMSQHIQTACTVTLGDCMKAQNLPTSYIFIWSFFKLPLIILFGLLIFPFLEKKLFSQKTNILLLAPLTCTVLSIIFLLIIFNVNLYDELRQIMFLIPIIFIISLIVLYNYSKKITLIITSFFIIFFIYQNIKLFPYNYLWLNNFNIFIQVDKNFEKDYWGVSTKKIANYLNKNNLENNACVISNRNEGIKHFLKSSNICLKPFSDLHKKNNRPFYVVMMERALNKGTPINCTLIHEESIKINLSQEKVSLAKVYKCI